MRTLKKCPQSQETLHILPENSHIVKQTLVVQKIEKTKKERKKQSSLLYKSYKRGGREKEKKRGKGGYVL